MLYRSLNDKGMKASVVGLGAEHLDKQPYSLTEEVIDAALECGINIIDVFMPGAQVRKDISQALKGRRKEVLLQGHIGSVESKDGQADRTRNLDICKRYVEEFLTIFKTDYIDLGIMFYIDTEKDFAESFNTGYIDYVRDLKRQGMIKMIGASCHNPTTAIKMVEEGLVEMLMFSINPAYDMFPADFGIEEAFSDKAENIVYEGIEPARAKLYRLCQQKNIPITVMKTLGAGRLLSAEHTPFLQPLSVGQCIHYALTRPSVVSTLIGCRSRAEVLHAANYINLTDEERDYSQIAGNFKDTMKGKCMYCNHCLPCPVNIDVAALTKLLDIALLDTSNVPESIRQHYSVLEHKASECLECGSCESNCPFGVKVTENMQKAKEIFGE